MSNEKHDVYCIGYKRVYYPGTVAAGHAFDYESATCEKDILCCCVPSVYNLKFEIELETEYDWCGSGYCGATYGSMVRRRVEDFGPLTHVPKDHKPIKIEAAYYDSQNDDLVFNNNFEDDEDEDYFGNYDIYNNVFYLDWNGGDSYYPMGAAGVREDLFEELPRAFSNRPVWIFHGESATGKSTLAYLLAGKTVYETDSAENGVLPDELWYDVIVMGNKWPNITIDDIRNRIEEDAEIFVVTFEKED